MTELGIVIGAKFGHQSTVDGTRFEHRASDNSPIALTVVYGRDNEVGAIEPGPGLVERDIVDLEQSIRDELLADSGTKFGREYLFGSCPVKGAWGEGAVRLMPVPPGSPLPQQWAADHPFLLEFSYSASSNGLVDMTRRQERAWSLSLFLGTVLEGGVFARDHHHRLHWVLHPDSHPDAEYVTELAQEWYQAPEVPAVGDVPLNLEAEAMEVMPAEDYYTARGLTMGRSLRVPDSLRTSLKAFEALEGGDRDTFLRGAYWYRHAGIVHSYSRSAYLSALIQAIEALLPAAPGGPECPECGRSTGPGPTRRFSQFLDEIAPGQKLERSRGLLYGARSGIVHGGKLLRSDMDSGFGGLDRHTVYEWNAQDDARLAARAALVNWLTPGTLLSGRDQQ